ncbi:arginase family protein [Priestia megaterium]
MRKEVEMMYLSVDMEVLDIGYGGGVGGGTRGGMRREELFEGV